MILYGQRQNEIVTLRLNPNHWEVFFCCYEGFARKMLKRDLHEGERFAWDAPLEQGKEVSVEGWTP